MVYLTIIDGLDHVILEVLQALIPLVFFFMIFQILSLKLPKEYILNLSKGIIITLIGMILFFQGVKIAFFPVGQQIGEFFGSLEHIWLLIPFGFVLGFLAVYAEPAVRVLCHQIEDSSSGYIRGSFILYSLSFGVAISVSIGMARIVYGIPFQPIIICGYLLAIALMWFTDKDFIGIAIDSGAVSTGPMAVTFLMSLAVGVAEAIGGRDPIVEGFGLIALISLTPILMVMILGVIFRYKNTGEIL